MKLKIERAKFNNPSLQIVAKALEKGLRANYQDTKVEIVNCPNLKNGIVRLREYQDMSA